MKALSNHGFERPVPLKKHHAERPMHAFNLTRLKVLLLAWGGSLERERGVAQQPMRAGANCAHPSIRDHWAQRCMSRCPDEVVNLKQDAQCLTPQASLVIYRPTAGYERLSRPFPARE
ncbi:hypothetical protein TNCV_4877971 [Trichonephila clavipes]|nr:hypothetical protein TNCV_4877971 [Trichonephila clavipes]